MKIRVSTAGGGLVWEFDVLEAVALREEVAGAAGVPLPMHATALVIEAVSSEPGAYLRHADMRHGPHALVLSELTAVNGKVKK